MVPRLIFAALMFSSLASRPDGASARRRAAPEVHPVQVQPTLAPAPICPPPRS